MKKYLLLFLILIAAGVFLIVKSRTIPSENRLITVDDVKKTEIINLVSEICQLHKTGENKKMRSLCMSVDDETFNENLELLDQIINIDFSNASVTKPVLESKESFVDFKTNSEKFRIVVYEYNNKQYFKQIIKLWN